MNNDNYIVRKFNFIPENVTCSECSLNYCGKDNKSRTFCQEFSIHIDPNNADLNQEMAKKCEYFMPDGLPRHKIRNKERRRWYESDSF